ncbi:MULTISPECIES: polysaccharide deacetylase [Streptomyces]|uniref:Polysaccharide deacetylase n=1 Tax=Streptomyces mordarskii TaxID=1226758 RepID=A0ABP3PA16_9ACTN|nr:MULTISPECIES: polysaccharide deacetylase [Streptomyces]RSS48922.1 polysaccharide deacetylase [Streptomyces sp. WAC05858]WTA80453.1 polysaccharide deacetylase [Streptomyces antimycoticus]WTB04828.1 polysaccharide deacetylase [Streptomyces antimycoticus]
MTPDRGTVCLTFDFDAISLWAARGVTTPGPVSRGEFGAHAIPRILRLLSAQDITSTFFIPGHTIETYPEQCRTVHAAGHEIGLHGYLHEPVSALDREAELAVLRRSSALIERLTGAPPSGHRTPSFDFTPHTVSLLEEIGVTYDSSLMGTDSQPYLARTGDRHDPDGPYVFGRPSSVVELPVSWTLDDYPHLEFVRTGTMVMPGLQDPHAMFARFLGDVRWMVHNEPDGVLTVTLHPQAIGRGDRMLALEEFISGCQDLGVRFASCADVARQYGPALLAAVR